MAKKNSSLKWIAVGVLILAAFSGAYAFAQARTNTTVDPGVLAAAGVATPAQAQTTADTAGSSGDPSSAACSCCGSSQPTANGVTGAETAGVAKSEGAVQKVSVDLSQGYYVPNVIKVKAGVPAEITFGQSSGCTAQVQSSELGFQADLTSGPQTVALKALEPGTYSFACGMNMVYGKIVVE